MKKNRLFGILLIALAVVVTVVGILSEFAKEGDGAFAARLNEARAAVDTVSNNAKAVKNAATMEKKSSTARTAVEKACEVTAQSLADAEALAGVQTGDADVDALTAALEHLNEGMTSAKAAQVAEDALGELETGVAAVSALTDEKELALYGALVSASYEAVSKAEQSIGGVNEVADKVYGLVNLERESAVVEMTEQPECASIEECRAALEALSARAESLKDYDAALTEWTNDAAETAKAANVARLSLMDRLVIALADNFIGVLLTAVLLLLAALVVLFLAEPFKRKWAKDPTFSVGMALVVMLILQTYALGFNQGSVGAWAKYWFDNTFNVLRANTSVGIVALGMTLVIIIGGIDLAVGSTLAGVGTVLMTLIDTGEHGLLVKFGITGVPAFAIGIAAALATGLLIGGFIGLLVTKGRIPPFIVTLGVMNIIRSVAQYCTKSYTPSVPKEFEAISNTVIGGQRPLTILYWLVLAVIFYFVMERTVFGRYVYAVGSNERSTRLSGINVDRVKRVVYMISGFTVAIAAVIQLSRLGGMDVSNAGTGYELDAIAAVVVGGTAMSGGRGKILGTILGVLIIGIMNNLLILLGVDSFLTDAFKGAIVVAAVLMQRK